MLAGIQGPFGEGKKRQAGEGPRLSRSRKSPGGTAGAGGEGGYCRSTMAMLCASGAPLGARRALRRGGKEPFMSPAQQPGL